MEEALKRKTMSGMVWSSIQKFGTLVLAFASNIVLARLLTPDDFGYIGLLAIFIAVSGTFVDGGLGSALIQKKEPTGVDYSTVFYANIGISALLYGILFVSAPAIANFYRLPLLSPILRLQGLLLMANAFSLVQSNKLRKNMRIKVLAKANIFSAGLSVIAAIILAFCGWGVWALVWQQLLMSVLNAIFLWSAAQWHPTFQFSFASFKSLFSFGSFILFSNLVNTFCNNVQGLIIGRLFSAADMGYYSQARKLEEIPSSGVSNVVDQVSYPLLSAKQDKREEMVAILRRLIVTTAYLTFPLMFFLIIVAKPLLVGLYSEKWLPSVPYFQLLCIAGLAICLQSANYYAVAARGESGSLFRWTLIKRGVALIFLLIGAWFSIYGLLIGVICGSYFIYFCNSYLAQKFLNYGLLSQFKDLLPIITLCLGCGGIAWLLGHFVGSGSYGKQILGGLFFAALYLGISHTFRFEPYIVFKQNFNTFILSHFKK